MALNLAKKGRQVVVYDLAEAPVRELVAAGAKVRVFQQRNRRRRIPLNQMHLDDCPQVITAVYQLKWFCYFE